MVLAMADHETPDTRSWRRPRPRPRPRRRGGGSLLAATEEGAYVDLTLGLGGHAAMLLDAHPSLRLLGIDRDREALAVAAGRLARFGSRVELRHARSDSPPRSAGREPASTT